VSPGRRQIVLHNTRDCMISKMNVYWHVMLCACLCHFKDVLYTIVIKGEIDAIVL
jgi:hypothetical protein